MEQSAGSDMIEIDFDTFESFLEFIENSVKDNGSRYIYRGQAKYSWALQPAAGRKEFFVEEGQDKGKFKLWCDRAIAYSGKLPSEELELLAVAQHHGLSTRLLDWSENVLAALYFGVRGLENEDGAFFCYQPVRHVGIDSPPLDDLDYVAEYRPRAVTARIVNQSGLFTYHGQPNMPLKPEPLPDNPKLNNLIKMRIPAHLKSYILHKLDVCGVNSVSLFPDLDGLSVYINWLATNTAEFEKIKKMFGVPVMN